ncbi:MAG: tetratricopeptide repeat protein [Bacteroidales bacterium]|nr:tetratricopeptide repeat protein [Bacteroidales bacterium]
MKKQKILKGKVLVTTILLSLFSAAMLWSQEKMPITTSSQEAKALFLKGRQQLENFQWEKANQLMEKAIKLDPFFAMAYLYQANAIGHGKVYSETFLDRACKLSDLVSEPEKEMILFARAYQSGHISAMKKHCDAMLQLCPDDERFLNCVGWHHYMNGDYRNAALYYKRATRENDKFHPAFKMLGKSMVSLGKREEAEQCFKKYVELLPNHADSWMSYARFLKSERRNDEAADHYQKALELDPDLALAYKDLGDIAFFSGNIQSARQYYRDLYKQAPSLGWKFWALRLEASIYLHENKFEEAMRVMDRYNLLAREKDRPYHQFQGKVYYGYILTQQGKIDKGLNQYNEARKIAKTNDFHPKLRKKLITRSHLSAFHAMAQNGYMEEPESVKSKCKEMLSQVKDPKQWELYHRMCATIEINNGNYRKARKYLKKSGDNPLVWYFMGLAYQKSGREKKALQWYRKVVDHHNNSIYLSSIRNHALANVLE